MAASDPRQAEALAEALRASGANAAALGGPDGDLDAALALDADTLLVLEADPPGSTCEPIIDALRGHPRARWASVIRIVSAALESEPTRSVALASIASHVAAAAGAGVELAVRAKGKLPYTTQLQPLGMNRVLRVLADTHRTLRVELSGTWGVATMDLHEGRVLSVRAELDGSRDGLSDVQALAALLTMSEAQLQIESGGAPARSWNVPVAAALARASALAHPNQPRIAWARTEASAPIEPRDTAAQAPERVLDGTESGTRPRSDLAITRETPLQELIGCVEATRVPVPASQPTPSAPARTFRSRGKLGAGAFIAVLGTALALILLARIDPGSQGIARTASGHTDVVQRSTSQIPEVRAAPPEPPATAPAPTPIPSPDPEPAVAAGPARESAAPHLRDENPGQLKEAQLIVKRARRQRRAGQLERAEASYLEAIARLSNYPLAIAGLTRVYLERRNGAEAVRWAEQLVKLQPNRDSHQLLLGDAYALRGNRVEAEQAWQQASQLGSRTASKRLEMR